jgi:hypothetical protein
VLAAIVDNQKNILTYFLFLGEVSVLSHVCTRLRPLKKIETLYRRGDRVLSQKKEA